MKLQNHQCTAALSTSLDAPIIWSIIKGRLLAYIAAMPNKWKAMLKKKFSFDQWIIDGNRCCEQYTSYN